MAILITYNCGCGAKPDKYRLLLGWESVIEEAKQHSLKTGHTVHITGVISSSKST